MLTRRFRKQLTYGVIFCLAGLVLVGLFAIPFFPQKEELDITDASNFEYAEIEIEAVDVIRNTSVQGASSSTVDLVARLRNPNSGAGIADYPVQFVVFDPTGRQIASAAQTSYIAPGAVQYIIELGVNVGQATVGSVKLEEPASPQFISVPSTVSRPSFSSFARERTIRSVGTAAIEEQKGIVGNTGTANWERVEVLGVAVDSNGKVVGTGKTFVGSLQVGEQREFTLQWPRPDNATARVILLPTTNVFAENNVIEIIGDPSLLR